MATSATPPPSPTHFSIFVKKSSLLTPLLVDEVSLVCQFHEAPSPVEDKPSPLYEHVKQPYCDKTVLLLGATLSVILMIGLVYLARKV